MAICPKCHTKLQQIGQLCVCTKAFSVKDDYRPDPLDLLGKQIAQKIIPIDVVDVGVATVSYDATQAPVDRLINLTVLRPEYAQNEETRRRFMAIVNTYAIIRQQNLPTIYEVLDFPKEGMLALTCDVRRGFLLRDFLAQNEVDDVGIAHIIHQILQALSCFHRYGLLHPHISYENVRVARSGGDPLFVKIFGTVESNMVNSSESNTQAEDVFSMGQLAISLITGKQTKVDDPMLDPDRKYLEPVLQIFRRATAPVDQRYADAIELLQDFETLLDLSVKMPLTPAPSGISQERLGIARKKQTPVSFDQIAWMHRPPQVD